LPIPDLFTLTIESAFAEPTAITLHAREVGVAFAIRSGLSQLRFANQQRPFFA